MAKRPNLPELTPMAFVPGDKVETICERSLERWDVGTVREILAYDENGQPTHVTVDWLRAQRTYPEETVCIRRF
jgi:hypothetical protein